MMQIPCGRPAAIARVLGERGKNNISGTVKFFNSRNGVLVVADISGLPEDTNTCAPGFGVFGFHIHNGTSCAGEGFPEAGSHLNPDGCKHPYHMGDLPPLFSHNGHAYMAVNTGRFSISDIVGHTVIIHSNPDDFTTQPSGNAGPMIACGVIRRT